MIHTVSPPPGTFSPQPLDSESVRFRGEAAAWAEFEPILADSPPGTAVDPNWPCADPIQVFDYPVLA